MYLKNRYFINATTSSGVAISNLDEPYWKKRFVAAGRVKINKQSAKGNR
jgi:lipoprotein Spr